MEGKVLRPTGKWVISTARTFNHHIGSIAVLELFCATDRLGELCKAKGRLFGEHSLTQSRGGIESSHEVIQVLTNAVE